LLAIRLPRREPLDEQRHATWGAERGDGAVLEPLGGEERGRGLAHALEPSAEERGGELFHADFDEETATHGVTPPRGRWRGGGSRAPRAGHTRTRRWRAR